MRLPLLLAAALMLGGALPVRAQSLLRYEVPPEWRGRERTLLEAGALLLVTDEATLRFFDRDVHDKPDPTYRFFNGLGDGATLTGGMLLLRAVGRGRERETAGLALGALLNAAVATTALKGLVGRERPSESGGETVVHGPSWGDTSFPSGHTAATAALAQVLARRYPRQRTVFYTIAGAVALSRVSSNRHFAGDTYFGFGVGVLSAEGALSGRSSLLRWRF